MADCGDTCRLGCGETCTGTCDAGCTNCAGIACRGTCWASCADDCQNTCTGDCTGTCRFLCGDECSDGCGYTCTGTCDGGCTDCSGIACRGTCSGSCSGSCADDCTGGAYMTRPTDFTGFTGVYSGAPVTNLTASDWNAFNNRLIAFAHYKGKKQSIGTFTTVSAGNTVTAALYNRTVEGLGVLSSYIDTMPSGKTAGSDLYASYIQDLKNALNSID